MDNKNQNVRFVRINGRIVPIKQKGQAASSNPVGKKDNPTRGYKNGYALVRDKWGRTLSARTETKVPDAIRKSSRVKSNEKVFKDKFGNRYAVSSKKRTTGDKAKGAAVGLVGGGILGGTIGAGLGAVGAGIGVAAKMGSVLAFRKFKGIKGPAPAFNGVKKAVGIGAGVGAGVLGLTLGTGFAKSSIETNDTITQRRIGVRNKNR